MYLRLSVLEIVEVAQLEEQRRQAEADRLAAMTALEARSKEILAEKEAKRRLEIHIAGLQSQLLLGGHKIEDSPAFRQGSSVHPLPPPSPPSLSPGSSVRYGDV